MIVGSHMTKPYKPTLQQKNWMHSKRTLVRCNAAVKFGVYVILTSSAARALFNSSQERWSIHETSSGRSRATHTQTNAHNTDGSPSMMNAICQPTALIK